MNIIIYGIYIIIKKGKQNHSTTKIYLMKVFVLQLGNHLSNNDLININVNDINDSFISSSQDVLTTNKKHSVQPQVISYGSKRQKRTTIIKEHATLDPLVEQDDKPIS